MLAINAQAPAVARGSVLIDAPPDAVFALLADVVGWPAWQGPVSRVRADGPVQTGTRFRWKSGGTWITSTVETFEPARGIGWRGRAAGTRAIHVWRIAAEADGTRVETEESMEGWLVTLLRRPMRRVLERGISSVLPDLKAEAER